MSRELPILTAELTSQIERHVTPRETTGPDARGNEVKCFGRTTAAKKVDDWPPSMVFGFNSGDAGRLDEILAFFGKINPTFLLAHSGFTPEVGNALTAAGYAMDTWRQTLLYGLPSPEPAKLPERVSIELVTPATLDAAAEVAAQGNQWDPAWCENAKDGFRKTFARKDLQMFLARYEGEPAGVGHLSKSPASEKWCGLGAAAVVPRFQNKGIHTALLGHRLHLAFKIGYEMVIGGAFFGSVSFRNQQRAGLRLAYLEAAWNKIKH